MKCPYCKAHGDKRTFEFINGRVRTVYTCEQCGKAVYKVGHIWLQYDSNI